MARQDEKQAERAAEAEASAEERRSRLGLREPARIASDEFGAPVIGFVQDTVSGTLHATGTVANEAVEVVRDVLSGALTATESVATQALDTVGTLGTGLVGAARGILAEGVVGIRDVFGSVMPSRSGSPPPSERERLHARTEKEAATHT